MIFTDSLENRFNKHPEISTNCNTSLDDEFIYLIRSKPDLESLLSMDINECTDPRLRYTEIISKLDLLESVEIKKLLDDYVSSQFWR